MSTDNQPLDVHCCAANRVIYTGYLNTRRDAAAWKRVDVSGEVFYEQRFSQWIEAYILRFQMLNTGITEQSNRHFQMSLGTQLLRF